MNYSILDDTRLLELLKQENEEAFAEIYNRYWKLLYITSQNIIRDDFFAKEAVQEVFISLWQRRNDIEIQFLKGYLQQAVRYKILKAIREQKVDEQFYSRLARVSADIVYENPLLFKEQEAVIRQITETLPEDCRIVFRLSREDHLTYKQIANQLGISEKTVEKKMSACLKHFREGMQQNLGLSLLILVCWVNN